MKLRVWLLYQQLNQDSILNQLVKLLYFIELFTFIYSTFLLYLIYIFFYIYYSMVVLHLGLKLLLDRVVYIFTAWSSLFLFKI